MPRSLNLEVLIEPAIPRKTDAATEGLFGASTTAELKQRSVRGALAAVLGQGLALVLQTGTAMVLARLLSPEDFGLQGMAFAMSGFLGLFTEAGLGIASVQRQDLTHEQASTMFWINVAVGVGLATAAAAMAPVLVVFFKEPRLLSITVVSAAAFLFNGLAVQHRALLNRAMRFVTVAKIELLAFAISAGIGMSMAALGYGYWALVGMAVSNPLAAAAAFWMAIRWRPGRPRRGAGVRSLLQVGGVVSLHSIVIYLAYNADKILLGRFWGAEALGLYGRAYQLANLPLHQLHSSLGNVAFPALSRAQGDTGRLHRSFLTSYAAVVSVTIPLTVSLAVFAEEIVGILLGPKWTGAAVVLRLLAPTFLALALIDPFGWFMLATGRAGRYLNISLMIAPAVILGVVAGLRDGPTGVALGFSTAMILLIVPIVAWAKRGTGMTARDYWNALRRPLISGALAGVAGWLFKFAAENTLTPMLLLSFGLALSLGLYGWLLLVVMGQKSLYADLLSQVVRRGQSLAMK
jgi:O-antigen/teichoic acid export membrane protein